MNKIFPYKKKYRSIRTLLIIWFFIFSIVPLVFMGWYFLFKFEKILENEVSQRLKNNGREIETIIADNYSELFETREYLISQDDLIQAFKDKSVEHLKIIAPRWLQKSAAQSISFYTNEGFLILNAVEDSSRIIKFLNLNNEKILLSEKYLKNLSEKNEIAFIDTSNNKLTLILFSKVSSSKQAINKQVGYIEQSFELNKDFTQRIKSKMRIENFILNENLNLVASTKDLNKKLLNHVKNIDSYFSIDIQNIKYGFIFYPITWGKSKLYLGLGTVREDSEALIRNIRFAFISVISVVSILLFITIVLSTSWFLKPVNRLIVGLQAFDTSDKVLQLPINNRTEVGLLTEAFNEMSYKIFQTRADLRKKIKELEVANVELKDAQTKLVHSAKMTSLGQLVAGVAHELNNPIGFIFSNIAHLNEYSLRLFDLIEVIEKDPSQAQAKKAEIEFDYIKQDLPRLIKSCQDGAQRTRDIVLGLRNFSRLEEAQLKEIDIKESLTTTLELLSGEIKNRIQVHLQLDHLPKVYCYASQINQVFMNILSNAVQAIQGPGQLWISTSAIKAAPGQTGKIQVIIQDSGVGMDPVTLEKIFEPFFTTKGVGQGTGLGLSISYGIIQNHGGEIQVRSQKGVGTEFTIIIPIRSNPISSKLV
jgi:two-component system, NtrC family, sensor kinase